MSAAGLGLIVLGTLQSSTWGWVLPKNSPITPLGFSLTIWMLAGGALLLWALTVWQRRRENTGADPLVHMSLLRIPPLRAGLAGLVSQNLILMGVLLVPLYLQLVLGLDALQPATRCCPSRSPCSWPPRPARGCRPASRCAGSSGPGSPPPCWQS